MTAKIPTLKTIESFRFDDQPSINEALVRERLTGEFIDRRENELLISRAPRLRFRRSRACAGWLTRNCWAT